MSKEEFLALYKRQQSSGLTIKDFCDNESYPASCFHYWKKKYGLSHPYTKHTEPTGDSFIPLNINHTPAIPTSSCGDRRVTIELPSGIKIHLNILSNPGKHTIFRLDAHYSQPYLCAVTFNNNDYGKRKSKLSGGI